ncbi:MAG: OmpA family protein [Bacteroidia bacterium]|nr:OmpA family protein [Bacteroidia bacterium]
MKKLLSVFFLFYLCGGLAFSQTRKEWLQYAEDAYKVGDYASAVEYYQRVIEPGTMHSRDYLFPYDIRTFVPPLDSTGTDTSKVMQEDTSVVKNITQRIGYDYVVHRVAECYRLIRNYDKAEIWYRKSLKIDEKRYPEDKMWFGMILMTNKKYHDALQIFESITADSLLKGSYQYKRASAGALSCYFAMDSNSTKKNTVISLMDTTVNSPKASATFATAFAEMNVEMLITSARKDGKVTNTEDKEEQEDPFYLCDIFTITKNGQSWTAPMLLEGNVNTGMHEGSPYLSVNKDMLFFTRWNPADPKECHIYLARYMNGKWLQPMKLPGVNVDGYRSMNPSLNFEEDKIYFASDRPGGKGKMDIWYCSLDENGNPGTPVNLGSNINSSENEVSPFYSSKTTTLYFSSDGHMGFGGLDIFKTYATETDTVWGQPVNMKGPVNSSKDDAYFVILNDQKTAYFSSDREQCVGCGPEPTYCYKVYEVVKNPPIFSISGVVYNSETNEVIPNALVSFKDVGFNREPMMFITDDKGYYETPLPEDAEWFIKAQKNKFFSDAASVTTKDKTESESFIQDFYLTPIPGGEIVIEGIEYDFDKATLRPRSKQILDTLADFLTLNEHVSIQISAHTDTRGSDSYNLDLSKRRAKSVVEYLITKGIDPKRLTSEGYGETVPWSYTEKDGTVVTHSQKFINALKTTKEKEAAHQKNRRTTFKVVGETKIEIKYKN